MKLQWLKEILGEAYTEEMDAKVSAALGERFVSRQDFNKFCGYLFILNPLFRERKRGDFFTPVSVLPRKRSKPVRRWGHRWRCRSRHAPRSQ